MNDEIQYIHMLPSPYMLVFGAGLYSLIAWLSLAACALWWCSVLLRGDGKQDVDLAYGVIRIQSLLLHALCVWSIILSFSCLCAGKGVFCLNVLVVFLLMVGGTGCLAAATVATRVRFRVPPSLGLLNVASVLASVFDLAATLICLELIILA